jgi:VCBS repeat-containing protein
MTTNNYKVKSLNYNSDLSLFDRSNGWLGIETESLQCGCVVCQGTAVTSIYHPESSGYGLPFVEDLSTQNDVSPNDSSIQTNLTCGLPFTDDLSTVNHADNGGIPDVEIPSNTGRGTVGIAPVDYGDTFRLHSNNNAKHTIYLDFDGHVTENTGWKDGARIDSPAYDTDGDSSSFSNEELETIQKIWQRVVEDFAPFNVNVTTEQPDIEDLQKTGNGDDRWGIRLVVTQDTDTQIAPETGGIAFIGSFNSSSDTPAFAFNKGENNAAMTISHEVAHTLGLSHDGISPDTEYHPGYGDGSWGPIMGAPFGQNVTQWSQGDYKNADNTEDDLEVITTKNGFDYLVDDYGNTNATAFELTASNTNTLSAFGIIERNTDVDVFSFMTGTGNISFDIKPSSRAYISDGNGNYTVQYLEERGANLDIWAGLYNADGTLIVESNPVESLFASFDLSLDAGEYYIHVDGIGKGDPFADNPNGYTDYGSLGQYEINGTIQNSPPVANNDAATTDEETSVFGNVLTNDTNPQKDALKVIEVNGDTANVGNQIILTSGALLTLNSDGTFSYNPNGKFESLAARASATDSFTYKLSDSKGGTDSATATITINGVNDAPVVENAIANQTASENVAFSFIIPPNTFSDIDTGDNLTYTATLKDGSTLPTWLTFNSTNREFSGTPENSDTGVIEIQVSVTDGGNESVSEIFALTIGDVNNPPQLSVNILTISEGGTVTLTSSNLSATDIDNDDANLTFTVSNITGGTFEVDGVVENSFTQQQIIEGKVKFIHDGGETAPSYNVAVSDGSLTDSGSATVEFTNVNDAPTNITLSNLEVAENNTAAIIGNLNVTDVDSSNFIFTLSDNRFEVVNSQLKLKDTQSLDFETESSINLEITATDDGNESVTESFTLLVSNVNDALTQTNLDLDIFTISTQTGKPKLQVTLNDANSDGVNELGVFVVDDAQGSINGILPGAPGYLSAALERGKVVFSALTNSPSGFGVTDKNRLLEFDSGAFVRFYLIDNSTKDAVLSGKTSTSQVIFSDTTTLKVETQDESEFSLAWNDTNGGNFNDLVVNIQATEKELSLGTNLQNTTQTELIDLRGLSQSQVTANFSVFREAAFNNEVYFYSVDDITGKVDGTTPNTNTYLQAALNNIVKDAVTGEVVKFSTANQGVETGVAQIETGSIIAPLIIINGNLSQLTDSNSSNNPEVYFPYLGANTDGVDHIRLLADNTFGFEDLPNGGDVDYNDLIVKVNFTV